MDEGEGWNKKDKVKRREKRETRGGIWEEMAKTKGHFIGSMVT